jgi:hypothetical protein
MPEHCEHKFVVYQLEQNNGGAFYASVNLDDKVRYCPFCGAKLVADEPISPVVKRTVRKVATGGQEA